MNTHAEPTHESAPTGPADPGTPAGSPHAHGLACMEIWGGNEGIDTALSTPGLDVWVQAEPFGGASAGGDIHYVSLCSAGKIARVAVADVSGHGHEVSNAAVALRGLMRRNINTLDQSAFAQALNSAFQMSSKAADGHFATALLATYHAPSDHLLLVNAGHPRPLLYRASARRWIVIDAHAANHDVLARSRTLAARGGNADAGLPDNLPLGIIDPTSYSQVALPLERGDLVLIVTDGVVESRSPAGVELGEAGLIAALSEMDPAQPAEMLPALRRALDVHTGGAPIADDLTLVLLHHNAQSPPRYTIAERLTTLARWLGV